MQHSADPVTVLYDVITSTNTKNVQNFEIMLHFTAFQF